MFTRKLRTCLNLLLPTEKEHVQTEGTHRFRGKKE